MKSSSSTCWGPLDRASKVGGAPPAVVDGQGDDRIVNDVASTKQEEGGGQQGGGAENGVHHQKLLVKVISKPLEAGTARQTPPMQKMPSRRLPYPMERRWAPSIRPTVPYG